MPTGSPSVDFDARIRADNVARAAAAVAEEELRALLRRRLSEIAASFLSYIRLQELDAWEQIYEDEPSVRKSVERRRLFGQDEYRYDLEGQTTTAVLIKPFYGLYITEDGRWVVNDSSTSTAKGTIRYGGTEFASLFTTSSDGLHCSLPDQLSAYDHNYWALAMEQNGQIYVEPFNAARGSLEYHLTTRLKEFRPTIGAS